MRGNWGNNGQEIMAWAFTEISRNEPRNILRNQQVIIDETFPTNKPDIIIHDSDKKNLCFVGTTILRGGNVIKKKPKILKFKLITET